VHVDRVQIVGGVNSPQFAAQSDDCWLTNSSVNGPTSDIGFCFYGGVTNSGAIGNKFTNSYNAGVSVLADAAQPAVCHNILIANNISTNCGAAGIAVVTDVSVTQQHSAITITGNQLYGNNTAHNDDVAAIQVQDAVDVIIADNLLTGVGHGTSKISGIRCACDKATIIGNHIKNVGVGGSQIGVGIQLFNYTDVFVSNNHIFDDQGTPTTQYAIAGTVGARAVITGNSTPLPLNVTAASDTVMTTANATAGFGWYSGTTKTMTLDSGGNLSVAGPIHSDVIVPVTADQITVNDSNDNPILVLTGGRTAQVGYIQIAQGDSGGSPFILANGATGSGMRFMVVSGGNFAFVDVNNYPQFQVVPVASTASWLIATAAASGNPVTLSVGGPATPMKLTASTVILDGAVTTTGNVSVGAYAVTPNGYGYLLTDSGGNYVFFNLQTDNNLVLTGTDAGGGSRSIASMAQRSGTSTWGWHVPVSMLGGLGAFGAAPVTARPTVTGAKGGNAALASLLTALAGYGLVTDSTT
jgi:hypothetical protein